MVKIGVLALQGAFAKHLDMLQRLSVEGKEVRKPQDLDHCDALIIPGGESTTIFHQLNFIRMNEKLQEFSKKKPLFGTCAGLILMSKHIIGGEMTPMGLLDVTIERNAFGRQVDSFLASIDLTCVKQNKTVPAMFIRAPRIRHFSSEVEVLAHYDGEPVLIKQGQHLGATFHPELTLSTTIHEYFVNQCVKQR